MMDAKSRDIARSTPDHKFNVPISSPLPSCRIYRITNSTSAGFSMASVKNPFFVNSFPPKSGNETTAERVIQTSLERYGRDRKEVEKMLNRFLAS